MAFEDQPLVRRRRVSTTEDNILIHLQNLDLGSDSQASSPRSSAADDKSDAGSGAGGGNTSPLLNLAAKAAQATAGFERKPSPGRSDEKKKIAVLQDAVAKDDDHDEDVPEEAPPRALRRSDSRRKRTRLATLGEDLLTKLQIPTEHLPDDTSPEAWDELGPERKAQAAEPLDEQLKARRERAVEDVARMAAEMQERHAQKRQSVRERKQRKLKTCPSGAFSSPSSAGGLTPGAASSFASYPSEMSVDVEGELDPDVEMEEPIIIFDWDDTLLPTWYITEVINPCMGVKGSSKYGPLPEGSEFARPLGAHAEIVRETLVAAKRVARVAIVTLAMRPWVDNSSDWFLPGGEIRDLLEELEIPVYYAREYVTKSHRRAASVEEGVDLFQVAKRNAMKKCLRKLRRGQPLGQAQHVISVGDSRTEEEAVKEIMWDDLGCDGLVKVIRLMDDPSLELLGMQLKLLMSWFPKVVAYKDDAYISMDGNPASSKMMEALMAL